MSASATRRAVAEIDFGEGKDAPFKIGNRSIHQFWHLFSAHFRNVLLAPQRRPDSGRVSWTWREAIEKPPVTAAELAELRRRLTEANRSLAGNFGARVRNDQIPGSGATLDGQVRANVREMVAQLIALRDLALSGFVCRTDAGLMLHSWGAAGAAQPYYPDTQAGEISGAVSAAGEQLAGVAVVLENAQGGGSVARLKTDAEGRFSFPKVAPGSYRIRVADRSDFPGSGLAVTMEREAITGLELRSVPTESISVVAPASSGLESPTPWYKRRLTAVIVLLLVLGIGGCVWRSTRPPPAITAANSQSSGWQSAKGQLAANGDSKNSSIDDRKVGEEGAFSTLANTLPPPKLSSPRHLPAPSDAKGSATDRAIAQPDDSPDSSKPVSAEKNSKPDSANHPAPRPALPAQTKPPESRPVAPANPGEATPSADSASANRDSDHPESAEDKRAKSAHEAAEKKRPAVPSGRSPTVDESPAETAASAGQENSPDPSASAKAKVNGSKSPKAAMTKSPAATGNKSESPVAVGDANTGAAESATAGAAASASGQAKLAAEKKSKGPAKAATATGGAISPAESAGANAGEDTPDEPPAAKSAASKNAPKSARPGKTPVVQPPSQPESAAQPPPDNPTESEAPATSAAAKEPAKQSASAPGKSPASTKAPDAAHASTNEPEPDPSAATSPAAAANSDSPRVRAKPSRKKPATPASSPTRDEASPPEFPADLPATISSRSSPASGTEDKTPLIQIGRVRASAWTPRIVQDVIVPTHPVTAAEEEAMETLRAKLLQERATRMPVEFRRPQMRSGFGIQFSGAGFGQDLPRWRSEAGTEPAASSVRDHYAELEWTGEVSAANTRYALSYSDGRVIAAVNIDPNGVPVLRVSPEVRASYWFGIEHAPSNEIASPPSERSPGFEWRLLSGASIPASWWRDDHWLGHGRRVEIPLDSTSARVGNYPIALIDQSTGWALVGNLSVQ